MGGAPRACADIAGGTPALRWGSQTARCEIPPNAQSDAPEISFGGVARFVAPCRLRVGSGGRGGGYFASTTTSGAVDMEPRLPTALSV